MIKPVWICHLCLFFLLVSLVGCASMSPINKASASGSLKRMNVLIDMVSLILAAGADPNCGDALGQASLTGHTDICQKLIEAGATP